MRFWDLFVFSLLGDVFHNGSLGTLTCYLRLNYLPKRFVDMKLGLKKVQSKFPKEVDSWQLDERKSLIRGHGYWDIKSLVG